MSLKSSLLQVVLPALLVGVAVSVLFLRPAAGPGDAGEGRSASGSSGFSIVDDSGGNRILLEAEEADVIAPPFQLARTEDPVSSAASRGRCVYLGPEKVNETADNAQYEPGHPDADHPGYLAWRFEPPATDTYAVWIRAFWVDDCGDSVAVSVDGSPPSPVGGPIHGRWTWNLLRTGEGPARVRLDAGTGEPCELRILNREDDLYIDQVLLLGTDRTWPEPTGPARQSAPAAGSAPTPDNNVSEPVQGL